MVLSFQNVAHALLWVVQGFYFLGLFPQIVLNHRLHSTSGLSDFWIIAYLNSYIAESYYVLCLGMPLAYTIMTPLCTLMLGIILLQRLYYPTPPNEGLYPWLYLTGAWWITLLPLGLLNPKQVGTVAGWSFVIMLGIYQIPQMLKIFKNKSVKGMSFLLVTFVGLAGISEFICGAILQVPIQTLLNNVRMILNYLLFYIMFKRYR